MSKIINSLADVNFAIEDAHTQGYKIRMEADGCAQVRKPDGTAYHVHNFFCDCQDALGRKGGSYQLPDGRNICKHVSLLLRFTPCRVCGSVMMLQGEYFDCIDAGCRNALDVRIVKQNRQVAQQTAVQAA